MGFRLQGSGFSIPGYYRVWYMGCYTGPAAGKMREGRYAFVIGF